MRKVLFINSFDKINFTVMHIKFSFQITGNLPFRSFQQILFNH